MIDQPIKNLFSTTGTGQYLVLQTQLPMVLATMKLSFPWPITTGIHNSEFRSLEIPVRSLLLQNSFSIGIYWNSGNQNWKMEITAFGTGDRKPECTTKASTITDVDTNGNQVPDCFECKFLYNKDKIK